DPAHRLTLVGLDFDAILDRYDGAGGGVGIDLATVGLDAVRFVRISNEGVDSTPEIDAIADVARASPDSADPDLDGDGVVGGGDMGLMLAAWGTPGPLGDLNRDGTVDGVDLGLLLVAWGR
ncbi:MAG: hypothetical protein VX672_08785, partial [Planctomycetota bacterium]|nr:hypothetical protein [Planctomycetota bacterium]